jgi:hypothetical protein
MKYLTTKDYKSELEAFQDCLRELTSMHKNFKSQINFGIKDRKHALFLLTGSSINSAQIALALYNENLLIGVYQIARYILEVHSLVEYFLILDSDTDKEFADWFGGKYIVTRYKTQTVNKIEALINKKSAIPFKPFQKDELLEREKIIQNNFQILSLYSHPTIYSIKPHKISDFSQLILLPVIDNFVDAQRLYFSPEDPIPGLMFSEFRLLFHEFNRKSK